MRRIPLCVRLPYLKQGKQIVDAILDIFSATSLSACFAYRHSKSGRNFMVWSLFCRGSTLHTINCSSLILLRYGAGPQINRRPSSSCALPSTRLDLSAFVAPSGTPRTSRKRSIVSQATR
ncbi:hypothetical protein BIW11_12056 [Tropilaelaps mercedesae]|uniref:Uncharacterized protein n=1 Tax=Tropilaelaps mercedesae TaxID=418985 RepID=A0A1V9X8C3_9ACAR|nr:hypothetical protein BIW11_12056 [Tropilaelaps mercedesae]